MAKEKRWSAYHYNAIAKEIRNQLTVAIDFHSPGFDEIKDKDGRYYAIEALVNLAFRLAKRFYDDWMGAEEGYAFDPKKFLNACSPNEEKYPLGELWQQSKQ